MFFHTVTHSICSITLYKGFVFEMFRAFSTILRSICILIKGAFIMQQIGLV